MKATAFVHINNQGIVLNNLPIYADGIVEPNQLYLDPLYKLLDISYPKYYKMDNLSKLGFLGVEIIKQKIDFSKYQAGRISQIFLNCFSSLDTDIKHQQFINDKKMPSPAVFVYTLPNIVMGEIAIRNKFYGENLFILADEFSPTSWLELALLQLNTGKADAVLGGWIDLFENNFSLRLYFLDKSQENSLYKVS